jgi:hypothetical protein
MNEDQELVNALQSIRDADAPQVPPLSRIRLLAEYRVENERVRMFRVIESAFVLAAIAILITATWAIPIRAEVVPILRIAASLFAVAAGCRIWSASGGAFRTA